MRKDRINKIAGLAIVLALVSIVVTGTVSAATHTVLGEFGTATW
jgi:hypothetical protein